MAARPAVGTRRRSSSAGTPRRPWAAHTRTGRCTPDGGESPRIFTNFGVLARNALQLRRARTPRPHPRWIPTSSRPSPQPAPETKGLFRRGGVWFATLALSAILVAIVLVANPHSPTQTPPTTPAAAIDPWLVDDCVSGTPQLSPVDCGQPHDGRIVQRVAIPGACPVATDAYVRHGTGISNVYCIDTDE